NPDSELLEPLDRLRRKRDEPPFGPVRIRRSPAASRNAEPSLDVRQELHRPEVAARSGNLPSTHSAKSPCDLGHIESGLHVLSLREVLLLIDLRRSVTLNAR